MIKLNWRSSSFWRKLNNIWYANFHNLSRESSHSADQHVLSLLQSCERIAQTAQVHGLMLKNGLIDAEFPLSKLLAKISLQDIEYASSVFEQVKTPNVYMFNTMIRGYSDSEDPQKGLVLFNCLRAQCLSMDRFTVVSVMKCCSRMLKTRTGIGVHGIVVKFGFDSFLNVQNALLHLYCVCGRMQKAHQVFDELGEGKDLVSCNTLMGCYLNVTRYVSVIDLFKEMYREGVAVSVTTIINVLSAASGNMKNHRLGESLHVLCFKIGFSQNVNVVTALVSMYGKRGQLYYARQIFDEINFKKDVILWNCLIDSYAKANRIEDALTLLISMKHHNLQLNSSTLAGFLSSCSTSDSLAMGQYVRDFVLKERLKLDVFLGTALVDMYAKSGMLEKAKDVFNQIDSKDIRCWTAMISGYGAHGQANHAIALFHQMEKEGFEPNEVTFLAVLNSCSHVGLVSDGVNCFRRMVQVYKLKPTIEHYGCVIDLLGRAGLLEEAYQLIKDLPIERDVTTWRALLGACRVYGNIDLAKRVKLELDESHGEMHPSDKLLLTSTYAVAEMLPKFAEDYHGFDQSIKKEAGYSTILS